jgi:hypothetical protein
MQRESSSKPRRSLSREPSTGRTVGVLTREAEEDRKTLEFYVTKTRRELLDLQVHSERLKIALMERELTEKGIPLPKPGT